MGNRNADIAEGMEEVPALAANEEPIMLVVVEEHERDFRLLNILMSFFVICLLSVKRELEYK